MSSNFVAALMACSYPKLNAHAKSSLSDAEEKQRVLFFSIKEVKQTFCQTDVVAAVFRCGCPPCKVYRPKPGDELARKETVLHAGGSGQSLPPTGFR